jgi:hypothetical protein
MTALSPLAMLATELNAAFTVKERESGETFICLRDGSPEWMSDILRNAHFGSLPNDFSYSMIAEVAGSILEAIEDDEDAMEDIRHERIDSLVSVYNSDRAAWLASHLMRGEYVNDAIREYGVGNLTNIYDLIALGMYAEYRDIWEAVEKGLRDRHAELNEA